MLRGGEWGELNKEAMRIWGLRPPGLWLAAAKQPPSLSEPQSQGFHVGKSEGSIFLLYPSPGEKAIPCPHHPRPGRRAGDWAK